MIEIKKYETDQIISTEDLNALRQLVSLCKGYDQTDFKLMIENDINKSKLSLLCFIQSELVGYLCVYPSYKKNHARISGLVNPSYRRDGIFSKLYHEALTNLKQNQFNALTFITDAQSESGIAFVESVSGQYNYSTYQMKFNKELFNKSMDHSLEIKDANDDDMDELILLGMEGFGTTREVEEKIKKENLDDPNYDTYVAKKDEITIGTIAVIKQMDKRIIVDFVIRKAYRKRGYGRELLSHTIDNLIKSKHENIHLNVKAENVNALSVYQNCGFEITRSYHFYDLEI